MIAPPGFVEPAPGFAELGVLAFTTTRALGSLGLAAQEPVADVMARWNALRADLEVRGIARLATSAQVHGARVVMHAAGWSGWLRTDAADGHFAAAGEPTALGVTVADCVPVFMAHPRGAVAMLHSGWRGTEARIIEAGIEAFASMGLAAPDLLVHLGPAICGRCYEVGPEVYGRLTGIAVTRPTTVDLRTLIADQAREAGVRHLSVSARCTRCDNARFYSHRAGDAGRQLAVIAHSPAALA